MILIKSDREGSFEVLENGALGPVIEVFNETTDQYEDEGKILIHDEGFTREFATVDGWDCVLHVADLRVGGVEQ